MPGEGGEAHTPRLTLTTVLALSLPVSHSLSQSSPTRWAPSGEKGARMVWSTEYSLASIPYCAIAIVHVLFQLDLMPHLTARRSNIPETIYPL